jgi:hypothetical protein
MRQRVLTFGPDANNKYPSYYFRSTFQVADSSILGPVKLHLKRDDGAVVYISGTEVARDNMPA